MTSKLKTDVLETGSGSGTIALNNQLSGMTTASLPTLTATQMPAGSTLQILDSSSTASQTTTSTAWVDTNLSVAITPSSTASKVQIQFAFNSIYFGLSNSGCSFRILRDSTSLHTTGAGHALWTNVGSAYKQYSDIALDSPSSTSAVTYKVQIMTHSANAVVINNSGFKNTIIVTEIKG